MPELYSSSLFSSANLVAYYRFESNANDSKSTNNLTASGSPSYAAGKYGNGIDLELASTQFAYIADGSQSGLDISTAITIAGWIQMESSAGDMNICGKYDSNGDQRSWRLSTDSTGILFALFSDDGSSTATGHFQRYDLVTPTVADATLTHVAMTFDVGNEVCLMYINGTQYTPTKSQGTTIGASLFNSTAPFMVGASENNTSPSTYFDGIIDDLAIFNRVLTAGEISQLYLSGTKSLFFQQI